MRLRLRGRIVAQPLGLVLANGTEGVVILLGLGILVTQSVCCRVARLPFVSKRLFGPPSAGRMWNGRGPRRAP